MRVTRLEIFGFKSFMDRLIIPLEGGITGVVGPNGCGKSNVVDALRWVLGESRASNLRGDVLEDIIFSGTEKLRPLGLAEVSISLRASTKDFFSDLVGNFQSVEMFPVTESLTDIAHKEQLDSEDAVDQPKTELSKSRPQLTVISGKLDRSVSSDDFKEPNVVAEVTAPVEKSEKQNKAEPAPFLSRYSWLSGTQEVQVTRRIYRSGESEFFINRVPCRLRDLKEFFRVVGLGARAHSIVAQGEVSRMISAKAEDRRIMFEEAAGVLGFKDKIAAASRRLEETSVNISRIDDIVKEVTKQVMALKRQAQRAQMRAELKARIVELDSALFNESEREFNSRKEKIASDLRERREQESSYDAELQMKQAEEQQARADMVGIDAESDALRSRIDAIREELNSRLRARSGLSARLNEVKAFMISRSSEMERVNERLTTLSQRIDLSQKEIVALEAKESELLAALQGLETSTQAEILSATKQLEDLRRSLKEKEEQVRHSREQLVAIESRAKAIEEQLMTLAPAEQLKRTLTGLGADVISQAVDGVKLFADGIKVPAMLEKSVQAVLGEKAAFLVSKEPYRIAIKFSESVIKNRQNSSDKLGLGVLRAGSSAQRRNESYQGEVPGQAILDLIEVQDFCQASAQALLGGVYFVDRLETAISFFEQQGSSAQYSDLRLVTAEGEIVSSHSFLSFRTEGGLIPMKNRVAELKGEQASVENTLGDLKTEHEALTVSIQQAEQARDQALARAAERQRNAREIANQLGEIRGRFQAERRNCDQSQQDKVKLQQQLSDSDRAIAEFAQQQKETEDRIQQLVPESELILQEDLKGFLTQQAELDAKRGQGRRVAALAASAVDSIRRQIDQLRNVLSQNEMELQKLTLEEQHLEQRFLEEYGSEILVQVRENAANLKQLEVDQISDMRNEVLTLRNRIAREGEVDPDSVARYDEESKRLDELMSQRADLDQAAATLTTTIERLSETSKQLFLRTFEGVRNHFEALIPRLFGGGKGELTLSDPANPLQSGVEVMVRPPGKKANSIELLSGGEKALCATALIFSMFLERPSPLCVLDEVDAPLDEANLVRFISMVREMSDKTQFVMITHNKQSMANADRLVGVTMQEPGASKILTVSLDEAYSQVA